MHILCKITFYMLVYSVLSSLTTAKKIKAKKSSMNVHRLSINIQHEDRVKYESKNARRYADALKDHGNDFGNVALNRVLSNPSKSSKYSGNSKHVNHILARRQELAELQEKLKSLELRKERLILEQSVVSQDQAVISHQQGKFVFI